MLSNKTYNASDIEVLEGLEPVRKRPGMYIGGTDRNGMHHLFAEVIDNSMDEAVAGFATFIEVNIDLNNKVTVSDNGRGIPIDKHPKYPKKSALEVILTTLHAGGKFNNKIYQTSGGLHGVGISVVNALSESLEVEVYRDKNINTQRYSKGIPDNNIQKLDQKTNKKGTKITFKPDEEIFDKNLKFAGDHNIVLRVAYDVPVMSIDKVLAKYRVHSKSMSHKYQLDKYNDYNYIIKKLRDKGASEKYPKFKYLSSAMMYRMKYKDHIKSNRYFSALMSLICFILLRLRATLI